MDTTESEQDIPTSQHYSISMGAPSFSSSNEVCDEMSDNITKEVPDIFPTSGPMKGGYPFSITFTEPLPDDVIGGIAHFVEIKTDAPVCKKNPYTLTGTVPGSSVPGDVMVFVMTEAGQGLGLTVFKYVDEMGEMIRQLVKDPAMQAKWFLKWSEEIRSLSSDNMHDQDSSVQTKQKQSVQVLQLLVYTAAQTNAQQFIEMIFTSSAGKIVFNSYKNKTPLPEDIARANGHEELAQLLQDINARLSKEASGDDQSDAIDWLELVKAVQKQASVIEDESKRLKHAYESDDNSSDYFADDETSSCGSFDLDNGWSDSEDEEPCVRDGENIQGYYHDMVEERTPNKKLVKKRSELDNEEDEESVSSRMFKHVKKKDRDPGIDEPCMRDGEKTQGYYHDMVEEGTSNKKLGKKGAELDNKEDEESVSSRMFKHVKKKDRDHVIFEPCMSDGEKSQGYYHDMVEERTPNKKLVKIKGAQLDNEENRKLKSFNSKIKVTKRIWEIGNSLCVPAFLTCQEGENFLKLREPCMRDGEKSQGYYHDMAEERTLNKKLVKLGAQLDNEENEDSAWSRVLNHRFKAAVQDTCDINPKPGSVEDLFSPITASTSQEGLENGPSSRKVTVTLFSNEWLSTKAGLSNRYGTLVNQLEKQFKEEDKKIGASHFVFPIEGEKLCVKPVLYLSPRNLTGSLSEFTDVKQATKVIETISVLVSGSGVSEDLQLNGCDIAAQEIAKLKDMTWKLVGGASGNEEEIREMSLQQDIHRSQLRVCGFKERREQPAKLFCKVNLAIMPSQTWGFGLTALEALSADLPVLVNVKSGFGVALKKLPYGSNFVVESEDPKEWVKAIGAVHQKEMKLRLQESKVLCKEYAEKYSWQEQCERLVERKVKIFLADAPADYGLVEGVSLPSLDNLKYLGPEEMLSVNPADLSRFQEKRRKTGLLLEEDLLNLSSDLGAQWKRLAYALGIPVSSIKTVDENNQRDDEKCFKLLLVWKQGCGSQATYQALETALRQSDVQRKDLAEKYCYS